MEKSVTITKIEVSDKRFKLDPGDGVDSVHTEGISAFAVCYLKTDCGLTGVGLTFTHGGGNDLVCGAIQGLAQILVGREIHEIMADFGTVFGAMADSPKYRWLGPHKGVIHLALASITNACYDLWAKSKGVPLWKLLIDLTPEELVNTMNFRYVEDLLNKQQALELLYEARQHRAETMKILETGYPAYDTSVGWASYSDEMVIKKAEQSLSAGFKALKLKVGTKDTEHEIRRAYLVRQALGPDIKISLDANQQWTLRQALEMIPKFEDMNPYWVEEPTDPDDIIGHQTLVRAVSPVRIALGEHVPNKVAFKNYLQAETMHFCQIDALRVGGVSEYLLISLMAQKCHIPVLAHVADSGQIHQHIVLASHIAIGNPEMLLEYTPHISKYFAHPIHVVNGYYKTPQEAGASCDFIDY